MVTGVSIKKILPLWAILTCPSEEEWLDLLEEVLLRSAGQAPIKYDRVWEAILDALTETVAEA